MRGKPSPDFAIAREDGRKRPDGSIRAAICYDLRAFAISRHSFSGVAGICT